MWSIDAVAWLGPMLHRGQAAAVVGRGLAEEESFGWDNYGFTRDEHIVSAEYILVFTLLLVTTLILQFYVGKVWHWTYLPEAGATMLLGMFISGLIRSSGQDTSSGPTSFLGFNSGVFFIGFLPPIIYNAGYSLKRRLFFANMGGIVSLAIIGTSLSAIIVGLGLFAMGKGGASSNISLMEGMCFGSLISATDPVSTLAVFSELRVDPTLFYLVFGESVLNDAIAITLFKTTAKFVGYEIGPADMAVAFIDFFIIFIGSGLIGYMCGLASAWFFKTLDLSHYRLLLVSIFVGMVYIPFLLSETLQLSGIVTILFTSITTRRYCNKNIPPEAKRAAAFVFELMAYLSETAVFLFLGMAVFSKSAASNYRGDTIFWTLFFCLLGRAVHVYPLLNWVNKYRERRAIEKNRRPNLISTNTKHMVFFSGLRGAVAYALANIFPDNLGNRGLFVATTMVIVLITIFIMGGLTVNALKYLGIETGVNFGEYVDKLKKQAKPYKFLNFEKTYIYPLIVKDYEHGAEIDMSSVGGSEHHLGSVHGDAVHSQVVDGADHIPLENHYDADVEFQRNPLQVVSAPDVEAPVEDGDGIQLTQGFTSSSGVATGGGSTAYGDSDSLW